MTTAPPHLAPGSAAPRLHHRTRSIQEAQRILCDLYDMREADVAVIEGQLDMELAAVRVGGMTVGHVSHGRRVTVAGRDLAHFTVHAPIRGSAVVRHRLPATETVEDVTVTAGGAVAFSPSSQVEVTWSEGCSDLFVKIPRARLETELEQLLGRPITRPLRLGLTVDFDRPMGQSLRAALDLLRADLDRDPALAAHGRAGTHLERLLLDGLLLSQPHNYSDVLARSQPTRAHAPIERALGLLREHPEYPWSTTTLAREAHLSARALQEGFRRDVGVPPMAYLRDLRLRRAHEELSLAAPGTTTVAAVANRFGFTHVGRFAHAYRRLFGESPSATLRAPAQH